MEKISLYLCIGRVVVVGKTYWVSFGCSNFDAAVSPATSATRGNNPTTVGWSLDSCGLTDQWGPLESTGLPVPQFGWANTYFGWRVSPVESTGVQLDYVGEGKELGCGLLLIHG
jgi:hypothetical protein